MDVRSISKPNNSIIIENNNNNKNNNNNSLLLDLRIFSLVLGRGILQNAEWHCSQYANQARQKFSTVF